MVFLYVLLTNAVSANPIAENQTRILPDFSSSHPPNSHLSNSHAAKTTTWRFNSGSVQNQVVELYTSEGCSSCPPADQWLSALKASPGLWTDIIPLAFHVDYWNNLGWKDRFSSPVNSQRQKTYRKKRVVSGVYTPGFVVDGQEWKGWYRRQELPERPEKNVGNLLLNVEKTDQQVKFQARFSLPEKYTHIKPPGLSLNIALLAMNEQTDVPLGENRGKTLHHDFVVTDIKVMDQPSPPTTTQDKPIQIYWQGLLELNQCQNCAIAAWVSKSNRQQPIQATGGYLR